MKPLETRPAGGSARGWSYFSTWSDCELRWFLKYRYRTKDFPEGAGGLEPATTARPLLVGSLFHEGVEHYYRAGWQTTVANPMDGGPGKAVSGQDIGAYSVDRAVRMMEVLMDSRAAEWPNDEAREDDKALVASLLAQYGDNYGQGGAEQDYPNLRLTAWGAEPALELELATQLPGVDDVFTSRFDAIMEDERGALWGFEHKTSAASRVNALLQKGFVDGQITGQVLNLQAHFPTRKIGGVILNVVVKDAAKGKPRFKRGWYNRTDEQLEEFMRNIARKSKRLSGGMGDWNLHVSHGHSPWAAALLAFDGTPSSDRCYGFGKCDFYQLCVNKPIAQTILGMDYVPRAPRPATEEPTDA